MFVQGNELDLSPHVQCTCHGFVACCLSSVEMKWWYRILTVISVLLKLLGLLLWVVQAGYSATQGKTLSFSLSLLCFLLNTPL